MIITTNDVPHSVDILKAFKPVFRRSLTFSEAMSGKITASDRGATADKYECTFTVIGDTANIVNFVDDIYKEDGQIIIDTEGAKIFGPGIDYSGTFTCNILNEPKYPVRDMLTSVVDISISVVSPVVYDAAIIAEVPKLYYQLPINRSVNAQKTPSQAIKQGSFCNTVMVDGSDNILKSEAVQVPFKHTDAEFGKLHKYLSQQRGLPFNLTTNICLELFLNSTSQNVIVTDFTYAPDGEKRWVSNLTMVNNV